MNVNPEAVVRKKIISNIMDPKKQIQQVGIDLTLSKTVRIKPKCFINILVRERFNMRDHFGIINIRSSLSRKGVFSTSGVYDPGFIGLGGVSLYNLSEKEIILDEGFRVGQMIVFKADAASMYKGVYNTKESVDSKYAAQKE